MEILRNSAEAAIRSIEKGVWRQRNKPTGFARYEKILKLRNTKMLSVKRELASSK